MSRIITLSTDFGLADHYVGSMKGAILDINPESSIVDITHEIPKYDITKAAFIIQNFYKYFPEDAIHVVVVDPGVGSERKPIIVETDQGTLIGPDNGVFSCVLEESGSSRVFEISSREHMLEDLSSTFHGRDIFAPVAAHLSLGVDVNELGKIFSSPTLLNLGKPQILDNEVVGEVIYEDSFGNLITNIPGDILERTSKIDLDGTIISSISSSYQDVSKGELLAIVGSSGLLEISVNQGSASKIIKGRKITVTK